MRKLLTFAGLAVTAIGLSSLSGGSALAMGCLNNDLPVMSLSHDPMLPNQGFGYNKSAYDAQQAKGNTCGTTQQSYNTDKDVLQSSPNQARPASNTTNMNQ